MPQKPVLQLRDISGVAASGTAVINLPTNRRYHKVVLETGFAAGTNTIAGAASNITEIRVKKNTRIQRIMSGTQLRDMNIVNGGTLGAAGNSAYDFTGLPNTAPGVAMTLFFAEPWMTDEKDQDALAWDTYGWDSFTIEVDFGAATTPTLKAWAVFDNVATGNSIVKWIRPKINAAGTTFDYLWQGHASDWLRSVSFYPDSGGSNAATQITVRFNQDIKFEPTNTVNLENLQTALMTPAATGRTANIFDLVLDHDALLGSAWFMGPVTNDPKTSGWGPPTFTIAAGGAMSGTITAIMQTLGPSD